MMKFRGFRASLNFSSNKGNNTDHYDIFHGVALTGAYRSNTELIGNFTYSDPQKRITPAMVKLPNLQPAPSIKPSKSTNDITSPQNETTQIRNSAPDLTQTNNNVQLTKSQIKEQKNLEKKRLAEQKKRDRLAAQEQKKRDKALQEQLKKDKLAAQQQAKREKLAAQEQQKRDKIAAREQQKRDKLAAQEQQKRDKLAAQEQQKRDKLAAQEQQKQEKLQKEAEKNTQQASTSQNKSNLTKRSAPLKQAPPPPPLPGPTNTQTQRPAAYSTNTLESSISRSSGPPPYTATPEVIPNELDDTGNTSFVKPRDDSGSWDLITQHRQQLHRPADVGKSVTKQKHLDLNYSVATPKVTQDNSEA